ncbi:MAG: cytochrome c biogenesis protein CcsA [Gemmatimonadaceae bacterium]|nr:cytochrome c biogenesis protein CcsA [Gemmatimonadaceae bacterium]NUP69968.1 cytochrome c biogenesis protein CcsA [Gemmatimonadaceae bacterium]NUR35513.1 cytochrome c biogenesis protein CcsA [Gemmatimonadaceae bacterium]NUS33409.1 cytochrome c biogenesis protein CcsA [Gemmatimonadaceae bacterium]NUS46279.1 cytochrome c biogenesis protein CcsA [Gemmatimonadaceae bacterium]
MSSVPAEAAQARPALIDGWLVAAALAVAAVYVRVIWFTPPEATQGLAQKIYYLHLPAALNAYIAFGVVAVTSVVYLWLRDPRADRVAESSAEVGLLFTTVVLTTGPIWGKPIWGTWWTWDARLTLTLFLWFIYAAYLVLRGAVTEPEQRARYSAVLGILGALLIPFIHMSVYLFRTLHPMPIVLKPDRPSLPPEMLRTLLFSFAAFFLVYMALLRARYGLAVERALLDARESHTAGDR